MIVNTHFFQNVLAPVKSTCVTVGHNDPLFQVVLHGLIVMPRAKRCKTETDDIVQRFSKRRDEVVDSVRSPKTLSLRKQSSILHVSRPCEQMLLNGVPDSGVQTGLTVSLPRIDEDFTEKLGPMGVADGKVKECLLVVAVCSA